MILPGEHRQEFEELHSALTQEWTPGGATEEDAVLTIAKAIWRKRRVQKFREIQLAKNTLNPEHPSYDARLGLLGFVAAMTVEPEVAFEADAKRHLRADTITYLKNKFPRWRFKSTAEWAKAVINEINLVLLPKYAIDVQPAADMAALMLSVESFSDDVFKQELALDERLDAIIDRAVKRLIQTKAMKQMLGQTGAGRVDVQPRTIVARGTSNKRHN
jgi:hypothetical protein